MEQERRLKEQLRYLLTRRKDRPSIQVDIHLGIISSFMLTVAYFFMYFYFDKNEVLFLPIYLIATFVMLIQFCIFVWMFIRKETKISKVDYTLIKQHTFLIMGIGVAISAIHVTYDRQIFAFVVALLTSAFVSSHRPITSVILYGSTLLVYGIIMSLVHFDLVQLSRLFQNSFYFSMIAVFYSLISYRRLTKDAKQMKDLLIEVDKNKILIEDLKNVNDEISRSSEITNAMMYLMSEVLKYEDIDDFFNLVLKKAIELIPSAQKGSVLLYQDGGLEYRASHGYPLKQLQQVKLKIEDTFQYKLQDLYSPCIIKDLAGFNTTYLDNNALNILIDNNALEAKAVLSCAFSLKNQYYGSINLDNLENANAFSEEDKVLIKHLATQIELALANKDLLDDIRYMSRHDGLTKLYSRKYFEELLEKHYKEATLRKSIFSICIIDTNELKKFNDQYGHSCGDDFLKYFSQLIKQSIGSSGIFGRTGGDEFTVFFPNMAIADSDQQMKQLKELALTKPFKLEEKQFVIGFSYGLSEFPTDSTSLVTLMKLADERMYQNKEHEKNMIEKS